MDKSMPLKEDENPLASKLAQIEKEYAQAKATIAQQENAAVRYKEQPFDEYLSACHLHLHVPVRIETDKTLTTTGRPTKPQDRWRPDRLKPWGDFPQRSEHIFDKAKAYLQPPNSQKAQSTAAATSLFPSTDNILYHHKLFCGRTLKNEADLRSHENNTVEAPVRYIITALAKIPNAKKEIKLADGMSAVTIQIFHYMVASGLSYSYITIGIAFIFLYIDYHDPTTLYYHVSIPDQSNPHLNPYFTAVGQVLSLTLLAIGTAQQPQAVRRRARSMLKKTLCYTFNSVLFGSPLSTMHSKSALDEYTEDASPRKKRRDDDDSDGAPSPTARNTRANSRKQQALASITKADSGKSQSSKRQAGQRTTEKQYCTQKCLLGLMQDRPLDMSCPNVMYHNSDGLNHLISATEFPNLLRDQFAEDLDHDCEPLGLYGARGHLFRVALASHGYVCVAKGSTRSFHLRHEGKIYEHLKTLQGEAVPVHLGNISLVHRYYLDCLPIKHFLLLSWGGEYSGFDEDRGQENDRHIEEEAERTCGEVRDANVDQGDYRGPNFLWNAEVNRVMLIDFERAQLRFEKAQEQVAPEEIQLSAVGHHEQAITLKRKASAMDLVDSKYTKTGTTLPRRRSDEGLVK
ncbi:MAG: hypothetical protein LQ350_007877 [Teloschistes chrysophthalmus]|nr:MAG: hypothetical protein LQ350_007877 [Niorma chrysophthalma]